LIDRRTFLFTPLVLASAADPPNLLLITTRNWRGLAAPWENDPDLFAPNLEAFGKQSVIFSRTYCACPSQGLTECGLLTSRFPHMEGGEIFLQGREYKPDAAIEAFAETPFAVRTELIVAKGGILPDPRSIRPRGNVPSEKEQWARNQLTGFYSNCRAIDEALGEILGALDKLNLVEDTVVAFTSDRGLQIGSHGADDGEVPFEESVRIPLAIRYPSRLKPETRDLASQIDIMPTLLTLCGMEIPEGVQGQDLFGKMPPEVAFAEGQLGEPDEWRMLVRGYDKLVATPRAEVTHLFNLAEDPLEMTNLAHDPTQKLKLASMKAQLLVEMKRLGDGMDPSGLRIR
jgi:arylsulfatase A-like enzyme